MRRLRPYAALAARALQTNVMRPRFPYKLTFCLTYWCNYACQTCNIWKMKPRDELTLPEIRQFFQRSNRFVWIDVTGGEVSLRKDFPAICEAIIRNCRNLLLLHFPTNGYLSDKIVEYTRSIMQMGPEKLIITVSTDGDEAMNDRIRGIDGGWHRQIETFRRLRELPGVDVVLGMTLSASNVDHFPQAFAAAKREIPNLDYRDFHVNIVHESSHYLGNTELGLRQSVAPEALAQATEAYAKLRGLDWSPVNYLERAYLKRVRRYLETARTPMRCHALRASCFIDSWGHVYPCTIYDRRIGSLREVDYDLARIWQSDESLAIQRGIWDFKCPQCWTPCEAYQSILGNALRPGWLRRRMTEGRPAASEEDTPFVTSGK
jgi:Fe-coproporphyrin III synthase